MALTVNEDWIRERVGLKHNNLEDVRSLSLPGTYHEKIANFGESLRKFTRLKSLDLSRNAIESLKGLETMKLLEKLNLYYNGIGSLEELQRLRYNKKLEDLDLRLNPVARNEPDYRLFLIHMLPGLKRLDDRAVRDSERKAALMHFSTDQANLMTEHPKCEEVPPEEPNPRVEHVKSLARPQHVFDEDDVQVLEFMNPHRGEITGSGCNKPSVEDYPPPALRILNKAGVGIEGAVKQQTQPSKEHIQKGDCPADWETPHPNDAAMCEIHEKYPNLPLMSVTTPSGDPGYDLHTQQKDPNLKYEDEIEAYTAHKRKGNFTANPDSEAASAELAAATRSVELYTAEDLEKDLKQLNQRDLAEQQHHGQQQQLRQQPREAEQQQCEELPEITGDSVDFIKKISALVDKYWNGSKSLLKNVRFKGQMAEMLKEYRQAHNDEQSITSMASTNASLEFEMSRLKHSLDKVKKENEQLKEKLFQVPESLPDVDESKLKQSYLRAQRDVKILRDRLQRSIEENKQLQERSSRGGESSAPDTTSSEILIIQKENSQLQRQIEGLNIKLKQFHQMQELAGMLQESHKSLVQTNDHLLKEMDESRQRHKLELQQLTWNYNQLKRQAQNAH